MIDENSKNQESHTDVRQIEWVRVSLSAPGVSGVTEPMREPEARQWIADMRSAFPEIQYGIRRSIRRRAQVAPRADWEVRPTLECDSRGLEYPG